MMARRFILLRLVSGDVALMLVQGLRKGVAAAAVVTGDEVEVIRARRPDDGDDRFDARLGDGAGAQAAPRVRIICRVEAEVLLAQLPLPVAELDDAARPRRDRVLHRRVRLEGHLDAAPGPGAAPPAGRPPAGRWRRGGVPRGR